MSRPEKRIIKTGLSPVAILGIAGLIVASLLAAWHFLGNRDRDAAPDREHPSVQQGVPEQEWSGDAAFGPGWDGAPTAPMVAPSGQKTPCRQAEEEINGLFALLDGRQYIAERALKNGSHAYFAALTDRLLAAPPLVSGESENLYTILGNTTHFYRVLGKGDVFLIRDILAREADSLETHMALLYRWSELAGQCEETEVRLRLPLAGLYEYAGFFLNTLGGQSYLFRREPRLRLLTVYYSLLILDRANASSLNRHGLDIRPPLENLLREMKTATGLAGRDQYLARLVRLRDEYARKYGAPTPAIPETGH